MQKNDPLNGLTVNLTGSLAEIGHDLVQAIKKQKK
jgi:hypothetical protein